MKVIQTDLPGCLVLEPRVFYDHRGFMYEFFNQDVLQRAGLKMQVRQCNVSHSVRNSVRGVHYQWPRPQGKLVSVLEGEVWDVAVDIRRGSPSFGRWFAVLLTSENKRLLWIPEGFAHGFAVLSEHATFAYLCTRTYDQKADSGIRWNDATLAIDWPIADPVLSQKDEQAPFLEEIPDERLPLYIP